jgi:hypothetical protein
VLAGTLLQVTSPQAALSWGGHPFPHLCSLLLGLSRPSMELGGDITELFQAPGQEGPAILWRGRAQAEFELLP